MVIIKKKNMEGMGDIIYFKKINKKLVRQLGCNDHFQTQAEKLKIFLNHTEELLNKININQGVKNE